MDQIGLRLFKTCGPERHRLLGQRRKGDVLVVWKLDRLSRSLKEVLVLMEKVEQAEAGFSSLTEAIDTTSPGLVAA